MKILLVIFLGFLRGQSIAAERPNIIFVLADDMGAGDTSTYGGRIAPTPQLERLAREGTRFTQYYSASPICSPSRCGLITGQYPARWNITSFLQTRAGNRACEQADFLDPKAPSLPQVLKNAGYASAHIGKWHLGGGRDVVSPPKFAAYGYDVGLGTYESPEPAASLGLKSTPWGKEIEPQQVPRHDRTRWMVEETLAFLKTNGDKPCFVNLWLDDTHTPWTPAAPSGAGDARRANLIKVIGEMDRQLGRLMDAVPKDTLLIFASDNGALPTFKGERSNGLRGSKLSLYEGGIRLPFIARWPGHVPAGKVDETTVIHAVDVMPTLAAIAAAALPAGYVSDGVDFSTALLGTPLIRSKPVFWEYGRNDTSFKYPAPPDRSPNVAMRDAQWKFLINADGTGSELYDLAADANETKNIAGEYPEIAAKMKDAAMQWRRSLPKLPPSKPAVIAPAPATKPNFIVINIDDMGYADIGPFGSKLNRTPNLDRMAEEGRKLTSFYAAPVCSPSRASLMTGCYAKRALPIPHVLFPADGIGLSPGEITVAEVLKTAGYATAIIGKWHLGDQPEWLPNAQGFDLHFGLPYSNDMGPAADGVKSDLGKPLPKGNGRGQPPLPLLRNGEVVKRVLPDDQQSLVEIYTEEALKFITEKRDVPFFLYLPHNAVHFPVYPGKKWAGQSPNGIYSDWVEEVDWSVGRILDAVRSNGLAERTLVIFTTDNGGTPRAVNKPLRGHKGSTLEGGMRVPTIAWWPGKIPAATETDAITGMFDILPTFAALADAKLPSDRKLDGVNIWPQLAGTLDAGHAHDTFLYYNGLRLNAVRHGDWKLQIAEGNKPGNAAQKFVPRLYNLKTDIGESTDVAAANPDVVAKLQTLVAATKEDLGIEGIGPGCRKPGRTANPKPLIPHDAP